MNEEKTNQKKTIFTVEDEPDILQLITINLIKAGYDVEGFGEAGPMLERLSQKRPDVILLDLMLPDRDGVDVCKNLRASKAYANIPIIMVTAKTDELDVVLGLELGADDYISKPFSPRELTARVKALLRRITPTDASPGKGNRPIEIAGGISIDQQKYEVRVNGEKISLTSTEYAILKMLGEKPGWVFSREKILDLLWGDEKDVFDRTVDVHIKNLRDKLGEAGKVIQNVRGVGYKVEG